MVIEIGPNMLEALTSINKLMYLATLLAIWIVAMSRSGGKK